MTAPPLSKRRQLSHVLLLSYIGLVLFFAVFLLGASVGTIRAAALAQARNEAERSASEARRRLLEWQREPAVVADLLIKQPSLPFYLQRGQFTKARTLIADVGKTSGIDYIGLERQGQTIGQVGLRPPTSAAGLVFGKRSEAWRIVRRPVPYVQDVFIVVAQRLGDRLSQRADVEYVDVRLRPVMTRRTAQPDAWTAALQEVSFTGEADTYEDIRGTAAVRIVSIRDTDGRPGALLVASVHEQWLTRRILEWLGVFGLSSLVTGGIAFALAYLLAARIALPFARLTNVARRLGSGDLATPVAPPGTFLSEPVALAENLENMRARVSALTESEREQRQELDVILDGVDEGIVGIDDQEVVHYANRQFLELVGRERGDVIGQPLRETLKPVPSTSAAGEGAIPGLPAPERYFATDMMRPVIARRLRAAEDRHVMVVREENAIEAARGMRDRILANLSHEFQTPLSAQIASIELLRDHLRDHGDEIAMRLADAQYRGSIRLSQLVNNLLDSVRIESGEMRLRRAPLDLIAVIAEAIELMQPLIEQRDQRVLSSLPPGPLLVGDAQRLFSVIVNLVANANKFAPDQTRIWIEAEWAADRVTVWVEDEGPGLPVSHTVSDLFAPFKRSPHEEPSQRGTGLGLTIVHAIVLAHGGVVKVVEPLRARGTRIGIVLPLESNDMKSGA